MASYKKWLDDNNREKTTPNLQPSDSVLDLVRPASRDRQKYKVSSGHSAPMRRKPQKES